jgi:hypothetical protein
VLQFAFEEGILSIAQTFELFWKFISRTVPVENTEFLGNWFLGH